MADFSAPGTEPYEQQQIQQTPTDMSHQNNSQGPGGYPQQHRHERGPRGNKAGDKIFSSKDEDDETKLFIGGLNWQTTKEAVKEYFEQYGEVEDVIVKMDDYGKSRCFGFVKFAESKAAKDVLGVSHHTLDHKQIDCKIARKQPKPDFLKVKKLFVGGLSNSTTEEALRKYFGQMGGITHFDQPKDQETQKKRGFCFITFESEDSVNEAIKSQFHYIGDENARVEVKRAQNKGDKDAQGGFGGYQGGQQRGQTGYWGDWSQGGYGQGGYDQNAYQQQYSQYAAQYPQYSQYQNQYPGYYGYPQQTGYDQSAYYNYNQSGYNYNQGGFDYSQQQQQQPSGGYNQQYTAGNENSEYGKAQNDNSSSGQYHPYSR